MKLQSEQPQGMRRYHNFFLSIIGCNDKIRTKWKEMERNGKYGAAKGAVKFFENLYA